MISDPEIDQVIESPSGSVADTVPIYDSFSVTLYELPEVIEGASGTSITLTVMSFVEEFVSKASAIVKVIS